MDDKKCARDLENYIDRSMEVMKLVRGQSRAMAQIAGELDAARERGSTIYIMGNGGSASTASHMAGDLNKTAIVEGKKRFRAVSLNDNVPAMLAWGNDSSYDVIFEEQLKNHLKEGDVVVTISGSGNSPNILKAVEYANGRGNTTIGIGGIGGGKMAKIVKLSWVVPDDLMYRVEDFHLMLNHALVYAFKHV